jgi:hypothetical protein
MAAISKCVPRNLRVLWDNLDGSARCTWKLRTIIVVNNELSLKFFWIIGFSINNCRIGVKLKLKTLGFHGTKNIS